MIRPEVVKAVRQALERLEAQVGSEAFKAALEEVERSAEKRRQLDSMNLYDDLAEVRAADPRMQQPLGSRSR